MQPGETSRPKVDIWPRGGAKSTTAELGCAWVCARQTRRYVLYVSATQDLADKHVQSIATLLEALGIPRSVNVYGASKGWRRQELRAGNGFNVSAYGLDTAARGVKIDNYRPDLIVFDDVDARHDSAKAVQKKIELITESVLPAGSGDCAVLFIQNRIHARSIAGKLADGQADFLLDRLPVVEEPAAYDLAYERELLPDGTARYRVTGGRPTWPGQSLATIERQINLWGRRAFEREAQQRVRDPENGLWQRARDIEPFRVVELAPLVRVVIGVDPSATASGDEAGIIAAGRDARGHVYVFDDRSLQGSPGAWAAAVVSGYHLHRADLVVAEANNGGEMVALTISTVRPAPPVKIIYASRGKITRAEPVQKLYEEGRVHHVGALDALEDELCSYVPGDPSPNRMDALVWAVSELALGAPAAAQDLMEHYRQRAEAQAAEQQRQAQQRT